MTGLFQRRTKKRPGNKSRVFLVAQLRMQSRIWGCVPLFCRALPDVVRGLVLSGVSAALHTLSVLCGTSFRPPCVTLFLTLHTPLRFPTASLGSLSSAVTRSAPMSGVRISSGQRELPLRQELLPEALRWCSRWSAPRASWRPPASSSCHLRTRCSSSKWLQ